MVKKMNTYPKISVITPTFNCEELIEECILNVQDQDYPEIEHLIMDGHSTDQTLTIALKKSNIIGNLFVHSEKDNGIYDAMNKGIRLATGQWIYFLGADDRFHSKTVLKEVFELASTTSDVIYGNVQFSGSKLIYDGRFDLQKLMRKNICHQAILIKKEVFSKVGYYNLKYPLLADYAHNIMWFTNKKIRSEFLDILIADYNEEGLSATGKDEAFTEDKKMLFKKNIPFTQKVLLRFKDRTK